MKYVGKRIVTLIITLLIISGVTFFAFNIIPGDASLIKLGTNATEEQLENMREEMGLNDPLIKRYGNWLIHTLQGDFGESLQYKNTSVNELLKDGLPVNLKLSLMSIALVIVFSLPLGILSAKYEGGIIDGFLTQLGQILMAIPSFFLGIILTYIFGLILKWFQPGNITSNYSLIWPAIAIAIPKIAMTGRFLRNSILDEVSKDYVRTAYSKGCSKNRVLFLHIFRNALIPVLTFLGMVIAELLAGSIIIEQVFDIHGIGRLLISGIANRDYPLVQAIVLYIATVIVVINFAIDGLYRLIDPRVKRQRRQA